MKTTRNTTAKSAILELIKNSEVALSHAEIQKMNQELCDRVTIYRILDRLVNEDVIHKIATPDGTIKYAACNHNPHEHHQHIHNHVHFSCEKCHSVTCLDAVKPSYTIPENYLVKEVNFTLSGLCPACVESISK
ncbi:Fur family transcriptional regulator, ferric uptake regulator [Flavobacterium flevense]|uniref:Transcriptional regulator n=1 Tax=Flavobacterium flevense TaxID=983 RepID=A0A4Y4ARM7_9FLAO|nr:transcriptional repressor [Flavobacterium flevense]GEC70866.1 transcriptional regulator [Flavobacterium flevense]SHL54568.1 Fur family transcriptional regulator, ferric uptake regulator [Flavobacterium flevense]